jgi:hypothetical protein
VNEIPLQLGVIIPDICVAGNPEQVPKPVIVFDEGMIIDVAAELLRAEQRAVSGCDNGLKSGFLHGGMWSRVEAPAR